MRLNYLALIFILFSCSKIKDKKLIGNWTVDRVEIQDGNGFKYYISTSQNNNNQLNISSDSIYSNVQFEFIPLGANFTIYDSLKLNTSWSDSSDILRLEDVNLNFKVDLLTNDHMVVNYYDLNTYRLKTFFLSKN